MGRRFWRYLRGSKEELSWKFEKGQQIVGGLGQLREGRLASSLELLIWGNGVKSSTKKCEGAQCRI